MSHNIFHVIFPHLTRKQGNITHLFTIMEETFNKLLGEQLVEHNESTNESNEISTNQLNGKNVGLYFGSV